MCSTGRRSWYNYTYTFNDTDDSLAHQKNNFPSLFSEEAIIYVSWQPH